MCGIAGFIGSAEIPADRLQRCLNLMNRRGPDHQEFRKWQLGDGRALYLLHSRLSIIDLNHRADQPIQVKDKWMVFNGELYNYLELKAELEQQGRTFATQSDSEVLLSVFDAHGVEGLDRCEGMWAFAIFDQQEGTVTLGRDRFGEKPLFLHSTSEGLFFGSEVKFIAELAGRRLDINRQQLYRYLVNGYKSLYKTGETFFQGIEELAPGSTLNVDGKGKVSRAYYWKARYTPDDSLSFEDAVAGTRERLIESVRLRLRSDVPLAFCMSGGVDSNALISIAKRQFDYDVHGFTIVNDDPRYNEDELVDLSVRELGIRHTKIPVQTDNFLTHLRALVRQHDAPVYTISYYAHWLLERSIAEHGYRISISGTAADELFSGYFDHHLLYLEAVKNNQELFKRAKANWEAHIKPDTRNPLLQDAAAFIDNPGQREHIYLDADSFRQFLVDDWHEPFREHIFTDELMRNRMLNELFHESTPVILHEDDHNAMYHSIENRSPFLDRRLFEFSMQIPTRHLVRDGAAKAVLREAVRGIVPDAIVNCRKKVGFNAPIFSFLDVEDKNVRDYLLDDSPIFEYVRKDRIETLLKTAHLPNSQSKFLFYFVSSKMFIEEFGT